MDIQTTNSNSENDCKNVNEDFWHQLTDVEKAEIINGIEGLNQGKRISFEEFLEKI